MRKAGLAAPLGGRAPRASAPEGTRRDRPCGSCFGLRLGEPRGLGLAGWTVGGGGPGRESGGLAAEPSGRPAATPPPPPRGQAQKEKLRQPLRRWASGAVGCASNRPESSPAHPPAGAKRCSACVLERKKINETRKGPYQMPKMKITREEVYSDEEIPKCCWS